MYLQIHSIINDTYNNLTLINPFVDLNFSVYVDFNDDTPIMISIDTNTGYPTDRRWNIRIQQLPCDATYKGLYILNIFYIAFF